MLESSAGTSLRSLAAARASGSSSSLNEKASICTFQTAAESTVVSSDCEDLAKHTDLWFTDGSVILRAESTIYRVHISQLSRHSAFFRDLFTLPQSSSTSTDGDGTDSDFLDGCPLVHLHDAAEDVSNLLAALYDGP